MAYYKLIEDGYDMEAEFDYFPELDGLSIEGYDKLIELNNRSHELTELDVHKIHDDWEELSAKEAIKKYCPECIDSVEPFEALHKISLNRQIYTLCNGHYLIHK